MKRILIIIFALSVYEVHAQEFDLGIKGGVNYADAVILDVVSADGITLDELQTERGKSIVFGGFARATMGKFVIQPEILFSENQSLVKFEGIDAGDDSFGDLLSIQVDKLDIPLIFSYKAFNAIRLSAGPVFSHLNVEEEDKLFQFNDMTVGYQAGIGFDISKLTFDARYESNLDGYQEFLSTEAGNITVDTRRSIFQFTIGYKLF